MSAVDKAYDLLKLGITNNGCSNNSANKSGYSAGGSSNSYCSDSCDYCYWCVSNNGLN